MYDLKTPGQLERGKDLYGTKQNVLKEKRADQLKVGDVTRDYGKITRIDISVDGQSYTIYGTTNRITVWKYTLIDMK